MDKFIALEVWYRGAWTWFMDVSPDSWREYLLSLRQQ